MVKKLAIIREILKGDHNAAAAVRKLMRNQISALSGMLNYFIVTHLVTFFSTTKHDNTAKCQNSLYIGKFYIILFIL